MWTAKLIGLNKDQGRVAVSIRYTDGSTVLDRLYTFDSTTKEHIRSVARNEVIRLTKNAAEVLDLQLDVDIDLTPPVVVPPSAPTAAQTAKRTWFEKWEQLQALTKLAEHSLISLTDTRITNLRDALIANWKPAYLGDV